MSTAQISSAPSTYAGHLSNGDGLAASRAYVPTHPNLFEVQFEEGAYNSSLVALKSFKKDEIIAPLNAATPSDIIRYSTVQVSEQEHIELNSDLLYCNHSCSPSVRFDVSTPATAPRGNQWVARAEHDIEKGDILTFFYPSTEWHMSQPFACNCGSSQCLKQISGASHISASDLERYFLNAHILRLKEAQLVKAGEAEAANKLIASRGGRTEILSRSIPQ